MVIEWFCLTEVIIYGKGGHKDPQWTVWKLDYHSKVNFFFFEALVIGTTLSSTTSFTGSGAGAGSATGCGCSNKSVNLLIRLIRIL